MKKKILQIGPYSAIGGVSIHIKRLTETLKGEFDFIFIDESPKPNTNQEVFNFRSGNVFKYISLIRNADVVHIHSGLYWLQAFHIIVAFLFRKKIIVSFHTLPFFSNKLKRYLIKSYFCLITKVIVVSEEVYEILEHKQAIIKNAFIPPILEIETDLPDEIHQIIETNKSKKLIVSNAFKLDLHNGEDLYGLDLLIEVAKKIKSEKMPYKIIFIVASQDDKHSLLKNYNSTVEEEDLTKEISILNYPISFVNLTIQSDLVIRATNTDGDALTIREALFFNKPVIASDVVNRPAGTILFESRNAEDLFIKIKASLESQNYNTPKTVKENNAYCMEFYINLYENI